MAEAHQGTALITGESSDIGAVYAGRLARRGYDLILVARNRDRLISLADRITNETRRSGEIVDADLNDRAALVGVEAILKQDASITLLLNNAGVGTHTPPLDSDVDAMTRMIDLNVNALICRAMSLHVAMRRHDRHRMSTVGSKVHRCAEAGVFAGQTVVRAEGGGGNDATTGTVRTPARRDAPPRVNAPAPRRCTLYGCCARRQHAIPGLSLQLGSLKAVMTARHRNTDNRAGA
ncbi:NAD(P)-dependent dehydrogenase (short-subunit alcohol dehydrogenase family) [Paraburkholderia sp. GAS334]